MQNNKHHSNASVSLPTPKKGGNLSSGYSLIELIFTISIVAILCGIAIPSLQSFIEQNKINSASLQLRTVLSLARQTAISHGKNTYVCELINNNQCNTDRPFGAIWSQGWLTFEDVNQNAELDSHDSIISIHHNKKGVGVIFNQRGRLRFRPDGSARSAGFYVCTKDSAKHILLLYSGRSRSKTLFEEELIKNCQNHIKQ